MRNRRRIPPRVRWPAWLALATLAGGCASAPAPVRTAGNSLATTGSFPTTEIESFFPPSQWRKLRELAFAGYVVMDAQVRANGSLNLTRIRASFPDDARNAQALGFARAVELKAANIGSHLAPEAEVYVIFFQPSLDGRLALTFARELAEPHPGSERRAMFLRTTNYTSGP